VTAQYADALLLVLVMLDLYLISTSRIAACIRACALQGLTLAILPLTLASGGTVTALVHAALLATGSIVLKVLVVPWLLMRALRKVEMRREVEPFVSLHVSLLLGALLVAVAFWASAQLPPLGPRTPALLVPVALATLLIGFLVIVSRKKAITQVVGYLTLENGIFVFGTGLVREMPFVVEMGILLDVLVGVFVFGIVIHHISAEFDHIDTDRLSELKD
jgi:hydrogenase-4 component E